MSRLPSRPLGVVSLLIALLAFITACNVELPAELLPNVIPTAVPEATEEANIDIPSDENSEENADDTPNVESEETVDDGSIQGRLAIIDNNGRLLTADANGENRNQLSTDEGIFRFPAWSPTSNDIAVIGDNNDLSGVFVFSDEEEATPTLLYGEAASAPIYLYWLPNGESVSFIANDQDELALFVAAADGSTPGEQVNTGQPFYWQWLANSRQAVIHASGERLSFMDVDGTESETGLGSQGAFQAPALSANNRYLAYQERRADGRFFTIKNLREDDVVLQEPHQGLLTMSWNPQASQIAYVSPQGNDTLWGPLLLWDAETNEDRLLTMDPVIAFFWAPDGRSIAYLTLASMGEQANKGAGLAQQRRFITLGVVNVESGGQSYLAAFEPNPIFVSQFIPYYDQYAFSHRLWSPDSRAFAIPIVDEEEKTQIMVVPMDGRAPYTVSDGFLAFWSHE